MSPPIVHDRRAPTSLPALLLTLSRLRVGELGFVALLAVQPLIPLAYALAPDTLWFLVIAPRALLTVDVLIATVAAGGVGRALLGRERAPVLRVLQLALALVDVGVLAMFGSCAGTLA